MIIVMDMDNERIGRDRALRDPCIGNGVRISPERSEPRSGLNAGCAPALPSGFRIIHGLCPSAQIVMKYHADSISIDNGPR